MFSFPSFSGTTTQAQNSRRRAPATVRRTGYKSVGSIILVCYVSLQQKSHSHTPHYAVEKIVEPVLTHGVYDLDRYAPFAGFAYKALLKPSK